ncbi:hypothetical protein HDV00_000467 [Rhizophlyctis rosea]|nr:hypothetical protein HDV00_000467 [Rhizophlyctis rosea]
MEETRPESVSSPDSNPSFYLWMPQEARPAEATKPYTALSYVWGRVSSHPDNHNPRNNGETLARDIDRLSSFHALARHYHLWVDVYSIDQSSHTDKCAQVAAMPEIYRGANQTVILFDSDDAVIMKRLAQYVDDLYYAMSQEDFVDKAVTDIYERYKDLVDRSSVPDRCCTGSRKERGPALPEYFSRLWTYQEYLLSKKKIAYFEPDLTLFDIEGFSLKVSSVSRSLNNLISVTPHLNNHTISAPPDAAHTNAHQKALSFLDSIFLGSLPNDLEFLTTKERIEHAFCVDFDRRCSVLHDIVYARLSVAGLTIPIDYTAEIETVVEALLREADRIGVLGPFAFAATSPYTTIHSVNECKTAPLRVPLFSWINQWCGGPCVATCNCTKDNVCKLCTTDKRLCGYTSLALPKLDLGELALVGPWSEAGNIRQYEGSMVPLEKCSRKDRWAPCTHRFCHMRDAYNVRVDGLNEYPLYGVPKSFNAAGFLFATSKRVALLNEDGDRVVGFVADLTTWAHTSEDKKRTVRVQFEHLLGAIEKHGFWTEVWLE